MLTPPRPCSECGQRLAVHDWSYVYGLRRRGSSPLTGEVDSRPLGTDVVFLCRACEWSVLRRRLAGVVAEHPLQAFAAAVAVGGALFGARRLEATPEEAFLILAAGWVALSWALRRRKPVCKAIFLHLRRATLAEALGLKPGELEAYLDDIPAVDRSARRAQRRPA